MTTGATLDYTEPRPNLSGMVIGGEQTDRERPASGTDHTQALLQTLTVMMQQQSLENQCLKQQQLDLQQQQTLDNQRLKQHQMELQQQQAEVQQDFQQQQAEAQQVFQQQLLSLPEQQQESKQGRLRSDAKFREEFAKRNKQNEAI